eukprot:COSAG01_NODE_1896_length_8969_cov_35.725028_1_plen_48_part_10
MMTGRTSPPTISATIWDKLIGFPSCRHTVFMPLILRRDSRGGGAPGVR